MKGTIGRFKAKDYGTWDVFHQSYSREELEKRRKQLAKVANSRILGLERAMDDITGERLIESPWYDTTLDYLDNQGKRRFSETVRQRNMSDFELRREIVVLEKFLKMKTSTVGGYRTAQNTRVQKFIEKGVPEEIASDPRFYRFLSSETAQHLIETTLDSEDLVDLFGKDNDGKLSIEEIIKAFEEHIASADETYEELVVRLGMMRLEKD